MLHRPYPKIASRIDPELVGPGGIWVATEKIHGAHVVVGCDGKRTRVGKRKAWLAADEPFFGWQLLRAELDRAVRNVYASLGKPEAVRLYGELFGGAYPHPRVAVVPGMSAVQTGIWYSPDLHFALFDVLVEDGKEGWFLSHVEVEKIASTEGLLVVPVVGRGSRASVEGLSVRGATRVPAWFALPAIEGNLAEGLVLKPDERTSEPYALKKKIPEFDDARFDEAVPFRQDVALDVASLVVHAARLVNDARVASARSRVGDDASELLQEIVLDVLVDLEAVFPVALARLNDDEEARLRGEIETLARRAIGG